MSLLLIETAFKASFVAGGRRDGPGAAAPAHVGRDADI